MKLLIRKQIFEQYKSVEIDHGYSLSEILDLVGIPDSFKSYVDMRINGSKIEPKIWHLVRPNEDAVTSISIIPAGGGDNGKLIATLATVAISYYTGGLAAGAGYTAFQQGVITASVTLVGSQLVNSMFPPPEPPKVGGFGQSNLPTVTSQTNRSDPYGPVIKNYGRNRIYPRIAAEPFVYYVGNDQYLTAVYDFGIAKNKIEEGTIKIGETTIDEFTGVSTNLAARGDDLIYYINQTDIESFQLPFENEGDGFIRTSPANSNSVELSFNFPNGIIAIVGRGRKKKTLNIGLNIRVKPSSSNVWTSFNNYDVELESGTYINNVQERHVAILATSQTLIDSYTSTYLFQPKEYHTYEYKYSGTIIEYMIYEEQPSFRYMNSTANGAELLVGDTITIEGQSAFNRANMYEVVEVFPSRKGGYENQVTIYKARLNKTLNINTTIRSEDQAFGYVPIANDTLNENNTIALTVSATSNSPNLNIQNRTLNQVRVPVKINFNKSDTWDVWVLWEDTDVLGSIGSNPDIRKQFFWENIIGYSNESPVNNQTDHTLLEVKIKATDQLNGVIDNLSAEVISILPYYDDVNNEWKEKQTNNPAWVFADILTGGVNQRSIDKSRLDVDSLVKWANYCETNEIEFQNNISGFTCNFVLDFEVTVKKLLEQVCSVGRATLNINNGKYGVVIDELRDTPTQMFNQRNIISFNYERNYSPVPDAMKCIFIDPLSNWQKNEVIAYNDGFDESTANIIEEIDVFACTNPAQAWRQGRYYLAKQKLRQDKVNIVVDFENLACSRGDLVLFSHDTMKNGGEPGRVTSVIGNNVKLDIVVGSLGGNEVLKVRKRSDGEIINYPIVSFVDGNTVELADSTGISYDDLFVFGQVNSVTQKFIVKSINFEDDLGASMTLIEYNEGIYDADQGVIIDYLVNNVDSIITSNSYPGPVNDLTATYSVDCHDSEKRYIYQIALDWNKPDQGNVDLYEIYVEVQGQQSLVGFSRNNSFTYEASGLQLGELHNIKVVAVNGFGNKMPLGGASSVSVTPFDDIVKPENINNFNANVLTETIALNWDLTNDCDIDRFYIRYSPKKANATWEQSTRVTSVGPTQNTVQVPLRTGTYFIKARDWAGNNSVTAARVVTQIPEILNIDFISEINAPVWDGTFFDTKTFGDSLTLRSNNNFDSFVEEEGEFVFKQVFDLGDIYTARFTSSVLASGFAKDSLMVNWATLASISQISGSFGEDDWDVGTFVRARNSADVMADWNTMAEVDYMSFGSEANVAPWQKFTNADFTGRIFQLKTVLTADDDTISPIVDQINIVANWTDRIEEGRDVLSTIRVEFNNAFINIPAIQVTAQENVQPGDYYIISDKTVSGFTVTFYDVNNNIVYDREFDWIAKGFGKNYTEEELNF